MAKKAVVLPMLMSCRRRTTTVISRRALRGIRSVGWTWPKKLEKGRPLSLAKAQVRRETDAKLEKTATTPMKIRKVMRTVVAAALPVEL